MVEGHAMRLLRLMARFVEAGAASASTGAGAGVRRTNLLKPRVLVDALIAECPDTSRSSVIFKIKMLRSAARQAMVVHAGNNEPVPEALKTCMDAAGLAAHGSEAVQLLRVVGAYVTTRPRRGGAGGAAHVADNGLDDSDSNGSEEEADGSSSAVAVAVAVAATTTPVHAGAPDEEAPATLALPPPPPPPPLVSSTEPTPVGSGVARRVGGTGSNKRASEDVGDGSDDERRRSGDVVRARLAAVESAVSDLRRDFDDVRRELASAGALLRGLVEAAERARVSASSSSSSSV